MRRKWRVWAVVVAAAAVVVAGLVGRGSVQPADVSFREELQHGIQFADSLERVLVGRTAEGVSASEALASLYLERHRLGLGSPFRLIDEALRDPMVPPDVRRPLGFAILGRTLAGEGYQTDPRALDLISDRYQSIRARVGGAAGWQGPGAEHLALIRDEVGRGRDARVGELTVRLAYRLAAAAGTLAPRAVELATIAAAQERDRVLAMRDARRLIDAAARTNGDPLALMRLWRDGRKLAVERPVIDPLTAASQRTAVEALPALLDRVEALASADESAGPRAYLSPGGRDVPPHPGEGLARRVAAVAQARSAPPEAPISVSVTGYAPMVREASTPLEHAIRERFVVMARSEEMVAAEYALLRSRLPSGVSEAAAAVLTVAVALRPYAQDRGWVPNDAAPTLHDLGTRYGVKVTFDRDVPPDWRGYLSRQLARSIDDFWRVFPGYDTRGLTVHFGDSPLHERALALHDPVSRTIYFPVASSAGVMAHEFAHDLDWLAARRYYGGVVGYRTDRAVRQVSDNLASALRQMASALRPDTSRGRNDPQTRPTEIFARNVDWFVSAALANEGRMNGHLSAVQDQVLTGYGSAMSPEASPDGGSATLRALDGITTVPASVRDWFTERYGATRHVSVTEAVRRVLETPISTVELRRPSRWALSTAEATSALMRSDSAASGAWSCLISADDGREGDAHLTRTVMLYAAEARARGAIQRWRTFAGRFASHDLSPLRVLEGPPWDPALADAMVRDVRDAILWRAVGGTTAPSATRPLFAPGGAATGSCSR
jgi:hypothetical protein